MDVRSITEQEAAPVAKARRGAVVNAIGGEPGAAPEGGIGARFAAQRGQDVVEAQVLPARQFGGQDADDAPVPFTAHREEQMEAPRPQVDVQLVGHHAAGRFGVGDEKRVLVGGTRKADAVQLAHRAARAVAAGDPCDLDLARRVVGLPERG